MTSAARNFLTACAAIIGFPLGYALPSFAKLYNLYYDPLARSWMWARGPGAIPMGYYGLVGYGVAGAIAAVAVSQLIRKPLDARAYALGTAWALTAPLLVMAYYTWNNWP